MVTQATLQGCDAGQYIKGTGDKGSRSISTYAYHMTSHAINSNLHH